MPKGLKIFFFLDRPPSPPLSQSLDDPSPPPYSEGQDPPLEYSYFSADFSVKIFVYYSNNNNNNNNNNNGLISVHPWYGSSPDIRVK